MIWLRAIVMNIFSPGYIRGESMPGDQSWVARGLRYPVDDRGRGGAWGRIEALGAPWPLLRACVVGSAILLGGCAVAPREAPEPGSIVAEPRQRFVAAGPGAAAPVVDAWWTRFDDPLLTEYVDRAGFHHPSVLQAVARVEQARAQARIARADLYPQVDGRFSASRQRQNLAGLGVGALLPTSPGQGGGDTGQAADQATGFTTGSFSLDASVSWELDLWGRIGAQNAAARADFLASAENLRAVRQSIAAQVARSYFALIEARRQVAVSEERVGALAEIARQVGDRADVGVAPPGDKALAFANLDQARAGLAQRREASERAARAFDTLIRAWPDGAVVAGEVLPEAPPPPPAGLPAGLLARRPDVRAARLALAAAGYREAAAERALLPGISLTGSAGTSSSELSSLLDGDSFVWSIAGAILQPIFQGGRLRAQVEAAEGRKAEAIAAYAEVALQALSEVETALAVDEVLAQRQLALSSAAEAAERSVAISFNRYRAGLEPFITVLQSEQTALDARSAYVAASRARLDNRVDLHLALGGGFDDPAIPPPPVEQPR
ncbi:TolC family protein [Luteimonas sp. RD2P54]|uniref:TolC family protein n=1 Tax=Luteimonas endophytica TaxID=3042023 RepID=A0ABT6JA22_9GAMM|nr:TolC family protein [Luteimonas endophytica]MDH5823676.1 TolC family protein [Luteimonas endophytica]